MGNAIKSWGEYPPEYNRAVHGFYHPGVYYGKKDTPFGDVKLGELSSWFARRNKSPRALIRAMSRAYWRHDLRWVSPKYPGMAGFYHKIFALCFTMFVLDYRNYKKHRMYRYH